MSQVRNSMETKLGQSFFSVRKWETKANYFSEMTDHKGAAPRICQWHNVSQLSSADLLWHLEGYIPEVISPKAIMREWKNNNNRNTIENRDICLTICYGWNKNDIAQAYMCVCRHQWRLHQSDLRSSENLPLYLLCNVNNGWILL